MSGAIATDFETAATIKLLVDTRRKFYASVTYAHGSFTTGPWDTRDACLHHVARWLSAKDSLAHAVPGEPSPHATESLHNATESGDA